MKKLLFAMLFVSAPAFATVHVITDPVAAGVTHCARYEGGVFKADVPVVIDPAQGNQAICSFDISAQPVGTVVYTATAVIIDPLFGGRVESAQSLPLSVTRATLVAPARPTNERAVSP